MGRLAHLLIAAILVGAVPASPVGAAGPDLPPAPYKPLPVGTVLDYGSWKCEVVESKGMETVCANGNKHARLFGKFVEFGNFEFEGYAGNRRVIVCPVPGGATGGETIAIEPITLDQENRKALERIWPLKVGNEARFVLSHGSRATRRIETRIRVEAVDRISLEKGERHVFRVVGTSEYRTCEEFGGPAGTQTALQTWWYDPALGVVVRTELEWTSAREAGYRYTSELKSATFPSDEAPKTGPARAILDLTFWGSIKNSADAADFNDQPPPSGPV